MARRFRRRRRATLVAVVVAVALVATAAGGLSARRGPSESSPSIDPVLAAILDATPPAGRVHVVAQFREQDDPRAVLAAPGERRGAAIVRTLRATAAGSQVGTIAALHAAERAGSADSIVSLWIVNAVSFAATPGTIRAVAARPEIATVAAELAIPAPEAAGATDAGPGVEPNVGLVGAPDLWALGFRGEGVTVAILDTGVDATHPDLSAQWRGGANSWFDPYGQHASPTDLNGHGTQSAGIAVGRSSGGSAIGVAPNASWIAAKVFNDGGSATSTAIHQSFQWVLDPDGNPATDDAPDVVNDSWTLGTPGCNLDFEPDLAALVAADVTPVFAGGNFGPGSGSSPSPANNPDAFAVGSVDLSDAIAASSSRGPTSCGRSTAATYPALVAPGVNVRSADLYGLYATASGTSVAAPHVTGALALLRQAAPGATAEQARSALRAAARDLGVAGEDSTYGAGRLDVLAAYGLLTGSGPSPSPSPPPSTSPSPTASSSPSPSPSGDLAGPPATVPVVAPNPANGSTAVAIAASVSDTTTGGSAVVAAEWFRGPVGTPGTGRPMSGAFGGASVTVSASLPASEIATLADGPQSISVRGRDAAGNWGPISATTLTIDRTPPAASAGAISPPSSQGATTAQLSGSLSDSTSQVVAGEWWVGADPGPGLGGALRAADGTFDSASEAVTAAVDLAGRPFGELVVGFRARDAAGTWGPAATALGLITPADGVFADGFETGGLTRWSSQTGASKLVVSSGSAFAGRFGLTATVSSGSSGYVTDATPTAVTAYHARFGFDGRGFGTGGKAVDVFTALTSKSALALEVQYRLDSSGTPQIRVGAARSGPTSWSPWVTLGSGRHTVEVGWQSASAASVSLWLDGARLALLTGLDTRSYTIDSVRLGPSVGLAKTMSGELQFDRFVSSLGSLIGP
jgi:subtilisin family serine protease